ncbi:MAG: two-component system, chemotaxis family, sensor kinase CheA [Pyrinomonadaceae bacterium]|nr:two-component system, chemotaxis family, sensor kinase CheA [Pyrinomonadaceae bacterium]
MDDQLLREFLAEADERIESLFADVERLRRVHVADGRARRELVARIFRHVHTLKGSAATLPQLAPLVGLAHEFENLLDAVRGGRAPLTEAAVDACEDATNALSLALARAARGDAAIETPHAVLEQLRHHAAAATVAPASSTRKETPHAGARPAPRDLPAEIERDLSAVERRHLTESVREGAEALVLAASFDLATLDDGFGRFTNALGECGEIISTFPGDPATAADAAPDEITFRILYTTTCPRAELETRLAPFGAQIAWPGDDSASGDAAVNNAGVNDAGVNDATVNDAGVSDATVNSAFAPNDESLDESGDAGGSHETDGARPPVFVRVPLHELDELVTATHELFTDTLAVLEQTHATNVSAGAHASQTPEAARARRLREDFGALEERVMALRMQPLLPVLERAARAARIAARAAGKEIELEVAGGEVRVDRSLAEWIGEPLLHLLRNAIDHGIETAEERHAAGKPTRGRVRLEVGAEGSRVRVRVADDGRGVDAERVARVAAAEGLLAEGAAVSEEHALRLIFRPGFSTAGRVSDVSGRGVGLDVVEHALERAGGDLRVRTARGEGTTFELRVPLTLALVPVVVVRANGHAYAFDATHVVAPAYLEVDDIADRDTPQATALWHGQRLPLVSLRSMLEGTTTPVRFEGGHLPVCVVRRERDGADAWQKESNAPEQFAIAVDKIEGGREALVRSLGRHATRWRGVGGAFAERDGTVALMLDLPALLRQYIEAQSQRA